MPEKPDVLYLKHQILVVDAFDLDHDVVRKKLGGQKYASKYVQP